MPDQPENIETTGGEAPSLEQGDGAAPGPAEKRAAAPQDRNWQPPRRKAPIINRRGPSEIDWALRMNRVATGRPQAPSRKVSEGGVARGTVLRIDRSKGYGFLVDAAGEHRFFHRSAVLDDGFAALNEQQAVDFEAHSDERGARAVKVRPAGAPVQPSKTQPRAEASPRVAKAPAWRSDLSPFRNGSGTPTRRKFQV